MVRGSRAAVASRHLFYISSKFVDGFVQAGEYDSIVVVSALSSFGLLPYFSARNVVSRKTISRPLLNEDGACCLFYILLSFLCISPRIQVKFEIRNYLLTYLLNGFIFLTVCWLVYLPEPAGRSLVHYSCYLRQPSLTFPQLLDHQISTVPVILQSMVEATNISKCTRQNHVAYSCKNLLNV